MIPLYKLLKIKPLLMGGLALSVLASCSSYEYAGYDKDGIYSSEDREVYTQTQDEYTESSDDALHYKRLFAEKSQQMDIYAQEGVIFTDINSYSSTRDFEDEAFLDEPLDYQGGYAGWGDQPDEISINIYNDGFYNPFFDPFYGPYYGGFYGPYHRFGYHPYSRFGFGFGYGYYSPFRWQMGWGYGWNNWAFNYGYSPYWGMYHHTPYYYSRRDLAYNTGRRDAYSDRNNVYNRSNISARDRRLQSYSNPREVRAVRSNADSRTYRTQTNRVRSSSTPVRRSSGYERSTRRSNEVRAIQNTRTRSNNSTRVRSSRSSSGNNSGTYRSSSSSSSRSSGTRSSSSRSSRGRGN